MKHAGWMDPESPDLLLETVGRRIKTRRLHLSLTQEEFAIKAGFLKQYANRLEAGQQNLNLRTLHRVAVALETDMSALLSKVEREMKTARR
jgi:transcriptional regulator with XRE-family HTH domain